jgi:hypothetical protein
MVLFQIDIDGIRSVPSEGDAPRAVDAHRIAFRLAAQPVEAETRNVQVLRRRRGVQGVEQTEQPGDLVLPQPPRPALNAPLTGRIRRAAGPPAVRR